MLSTSCRFSVAVAPSTLISAVTVPLLRLVPDHRFLCACTAVSIDCTGRDLLTVPDLASDSVTHLSLASNPRLNLIATGMLNATALPALRFINLTVRR
jgi:hypothetical protein